MLPISVETIEALGVQAGDRVLDVGVGDGNALFCARSKRLRRLARNIHSSSAGALLGRRELTPSVDSALDTFVTAAGPFVAFMEAVTAAGRADEALAELRAAMHATNEATDGTVTLAAPYLLAVGRH